MMKIAAIAALSITLMASVLPGSARADQNDSRLDTLFGQLQLPQSEEQVDEIVQEIWTVWTEYDDEDTHFEMLKGVEAMGQQRLDVALAIFDHVVQNHPEFAEAWNKRATVYYLMGRLDESMSDVHVTLDLEPRHFGALSGMGLIQTAMGNFAQAIEAFEQALVTNPHLPGIRHRIEMLKQQLDKNET